MLKIKFGKHEVGVGSDKVFFIAEIGNNHNGDFQKAIKLIDVAVEAGADCAKFQMRDLASVYRQSSLEKQADDLSAEYTIDLLKRFELSKDEQIKLRDYCNEKGILYLCTPWDDKSVATLEEFGVEAYKVASADFTNIPLLETLIATKKPLILSTGMTSEDEIEKVVEFLNQKGAQFALLHCNSTYPAPFHNINLRYLTKLNTFHPIVGYSGHERGISVSLAAVGLGAKIIERHITLDRSMEGPDHAASLEPKDLNLLLKGIRELEEALGEGGKKQLSQGEMINRENLAKSIVAKGELKEGDIITRDDLDFKSPGQGLSPLHINELVGKKIKRDIEREGYFYKSDLNEGIIRAKDYTYGRPWGIPVRYHDFDKFVDQTNLDLIEFHLSYSDMELDVSKFLKGTYDIEFVVHAPELFEGSHLMDLATPDEEYRAYSMKETQRVIDITRSLKKYFPKTTKPLIVCNIGGFSRDGNFSEEKKQNYYDQFIASLKDLNLEGVELIPQTMAPFPWHFGGQRYQNLFVLPDETVRICKENNLRLCFDISHSKLTCNYHGIDFYDFVEKVGPYTAHLHLGDASGVDGEGLQVGDGEIDFERLGDILKRTCPTASFIPEIWQGHKNDGEGFWLALEQLEGTL